MDDAERRLQAVADDAEREVNDLDRQIQDARRRGDSAQSIEVLESRARAARHRRDAARGALDKYRADKRRRN